MAKDANASDDESLGPACLQCRKRKQKCSRGDPCQSCFSTGSVCEYSEFKKRGTKPGYLENLSKRLDRLEAMVLGQSLLISSRLELNGSSRNSIDDELQIVRDTLLKTGGNKRGELPPAGISGDDDDSLSTLATAALSSNPLKRRRVEVEEEEEEEKNHQELTVDPSLDPSSLNASSLTPSSLNASSLTPSSLNPSSLDLEPLEINHFLPTDNILHQLCDLYFLHLHPWIPILHRDTTLSLLKSDEKNIPILQAITATTIKFLILPRKLKSNYYKRCREAVLLASTDRFSVETLQAAIIIAFDTIGSGRGPRSWSVVSSVTRVVEQLGLAAEEDDINKNRLLKRIGFLNLSKNVTEEESRRRVFWSIFLMDRFCSVTTGWNTSLKSTDVRRRLPIEGSLFRDNVAKTTRYFDISEGDVDSTDANKSLGGYAYLIEATECLSRVVSFLLGEKVNFGSKQALKDWFDMFQRLDSMLVRWKAFLPERWKVSRVNTSGGMDENLTLAHVTHNTSVLLLHQNLAYPTHELKTGFNSRNSAQTCMAAALEISTITSQFLRHVKIVSSPQFAFCVFMAARILLAHSIHFNAKLDQNFIILVDSLKEMSRRWKANSNGYEDETLAGKFAERLELARHTNSPIDSRLPLFEEVEEKESKVFVEDNYDSKPFSLDYPPIAEMFGDAYMQSIGMNGLVNSVGLTDIDLQELSLDDILSRTDNLSDNDYIFTWSDKQHT